MKIVEQVNSKGEIVFDYDTKLSPKNIFEQLKKYFPNIKKDEDGIIKGSYENIDYSILIYNITYLGTPHPLYKKRIQINGLPEFFDKSIQKGYVPLLMGIYTYKDVTLFCNFSIDTYLLKKSHSSSAHVYTDDMINVFDHDYGGIFEKQDYFKNTITIFRPEYIFIFLHEALSKTENKENIEYIFPEEVLTSSKKDCICFNKQGDYIGTGLINEPEIVYINNEPNEILKKVFNDFFESEEKTWNGIDCYKQMIDSDYRNKFQPEWAGFYLEYEFEKFINDHNLHNIVDYEQDKTFDGIDLDLYFPTINSFGDLKAHSSNSRAIQGNDWSTIFEILGSAKYNNHIYYIVCEHNTNKDKDNGYQVTKYWNKAQHKSNEMSYSSKMKSSVELIKYYILDINNNNKKFLSKFKQGVNSDGHLRNPKIMIDNENLDKFIIATVELQNDENEH